MNDNFAKKIGLSSVGEIKKGTLITLPCYPEGVGNYRILAVNGTQIKVVAMDKIYYSAFNNSSKTIPFDNGNGMVGQNYWNSTIDIEMTSFYNALPDCIKNAIVPQTIKQSMYAYQYKDEIDTNTVIQHVDDFYDTSDAPNKRGLFRVAENYIGKRYVYALDIDDVIEYFKQDENPKGNFNCQQLNELFFNKKSNVSEDLWLRSALVGYSNYAFYVYGYYGIVNIDYATNDYGVRPAFVIDLAKLNV